MDTDDVKNVAVLGAGAMGHGIALLMARSGFSVALYDIKKELLDSALNIMKKSLEQLQGNGKITAARVTETLGNMRGTLDLGDAVSRADLVIEAAPESLDLKKSLFTRVSGLCRDDAVLATNTSTMSITGISAAVKKPARFAGMHFFNPPAVMKLVEVIYGRDTSHETVAIISGISEKIGKVPVKVLKDRPGFIVNRVNAPTRPLLSAILDEGKIRPDDIDAAHRKSGLKMGPYELMDFVGLDIVFSGMTYYQDNLSPEWKPGKVISELVDNRRLGLKTGSGIYRWSLGKADIDVSRAAPEITPFDLDAVRLNEALKVLKEGVAASARDIDKAFVAGMNVPAGPFAAVKDRNPREVASALQRLSARYGLTILSPVKEIVTGTYVNMT